MDCKVEGSQWHRCVARQGGCDMCFACVERQCLTEEQLDAEGFVQVEEVPEGEFDSGPWLHRRP